jgi:hypothetical protein
MEPKTREFALLAHPRVGQPDRRHQVTVRTASTFESILSVLQASRASPSTF